MLEVLNAVFLICEPKITENSELPLFFFILQCPKYVTHSNHFEKRHGQQFTLNYSKTVRPVSVFFWCGALECQGGSVQALPTSSATEFV